MKELYDVKGQGHSIRGIARGWAVPGIRYASTCGHGRCRRPSLGGDGGRSWTLMPGTWVTGYPRSWTTALYCLGNCGIEDMGGATPP